MEPELGVTRLAGECDYDDVCPTVYGSDRATLVFQGPDAGHADGLRLGPGERAVELSIDVVREALRALDNR